MEKQVEEEVVVTLEHSSFGAYVYRVLKKDVSASVGPAMQNAERQAGVRAQMRSLDDEQDKVCSDIAAAQSRIQMAEGLGDEVRIKREQATVERLQAKVNELAAARGKLAESL